VVVLAEAEAEALEAMVDPGRRVVQVTEQARVRLESRASQQRRPTVERAAAEAAAAVTGRVAEALAALAALAQRVASSSDIADRRR